MKLNRLIGISIIMCMIMIAPALAVPAEGITYEGKEYDYEGGKLRWLGNAQGNGGRSCFSSEALRVDCDKVGYVYLNEQGNPVPKAQAHSSEQPNAVKSWFQNSGQNIDVAVEDAAGSENNDLPSPTTNGGNGVDSPDTPTDSVVIDGVQHTDGQKIGNTVYYSHETQGRGDLLCNQQQQCYDSEGFRRSYDGAYYLDAEGNPVPTQDRAGIVSGDDKKKFDEFRDKGLLQKNGPAKKELPPDGTTIAGASGKWAKRQADGFRFGQLEKDKHRRVNGADGFYILDTKDDRYPDDGKVYERELQEDGTFKYTAIGEFEGDGDDSKIHLWKSGTTQRNGLTVDNNGQVYEDGELIGRGIKVHGTGREGTARFSLKEGKRKTKVYGSDGKLLSDNARVYDNGAFYDKSGKAFHDRWGKKRDKAVDDRQGGYYIREEVAGSNAKKGIMMHHYADGRVYGERGGFVGLFKNNYYFGTEQEGGATKITGSYTRCTQQYSRSTGAFGTFCSSGGATVDPWGDDVHGRPLTEDEEADLFKDSFKTGSFGMTHFANAVDTWVGLTSNQYGSLFYSDREGPAYRALKENDFIRAVLGGIEGWTGALCERRVIDITSSGGTYSESSRGTYAHISAERADYLNYSEGPSPPKRYQYIFTMDASPAECGMRVSTWIYGKSGGREVGKELILNVPDMERGGEPFIWRGPARSKNYYHKVCMRFEDIDPDCLVGIKSGGQICNNIVDGKKAYENYVDMFEEEGLSDPTTLDPQDGTDSPEAQGPVLNPEI